VNHRYTPAGGLPVLKKAIVDKTFRDSRYQVTPEQVLVTNGGKHAVYNTFAALLDPGDEVLLPAPYWTTYPEAIKLAAAPRSRCSRARTRVIWWTSSSSRRPVPPGPRR
jgi:aspartate/methionine/tyrosine aminotransferase